LDVSDLPSPSQAAIDKDSQYMAFVTGQDKLSDKSNVLYIFDIRERIKNQDQTTGGFLIFDMVNMIEDNVTKLGFI